MNVKKTSVGLVLGSFIGGWHVIWLALVACGFAQGLLDWIYGLHSLNNPFRVMPLQLGNSVLLVVVTSASGFVFGWFLALLWNRFHRA